MTWRPDLQKPDSKPQRVGFGIWDTAGQERFSNLLPMYLRGSDAVFYCWDYNVPFNAQTAQVMYQKAIEHSPDCHFYLVMTKIDKTEDFVIRSRAAEKWATETGIKGVYYTSSLSGDGVQHLFTEMAKNLLKSPRPPKVPDALKLETEQSKTKSCCSIG
jgi:GTPase SAR1 family protein